MSPGAPAWRIETFAELDSTQRALVRVAEHLPEGACYLARRQFAGHGRAARGWESAEGGLYASFLLKPESLMPELPWALWWASLAALETLTGLRLTLKAPNDLLVDGRKLAGMLIDSRILQARPLYYVCGIGVNLNQLSFAAELEGRAISLRQLTGRHWRPEAVLKALLARFGEVYSLLGQGGFASALLAALGQRQVQIGYNGREFTLFEEYWHGSEQRLV